jgi:hypothetical protein
VHGGTSRAAAPHRARLDATDRRRLARAAIAALLAAGGIAAVAAPAFAATATYYVSPAGGGNCSSAASPCTLATALTDAASGSDGGDVVTIELAPGGYSGPIPIGGTESSLTLDGAGPGASVVNGGGSQPAVSISVTFPVALEHLGIIGGAATNGGGVDISNAGAHVTIEDSTIAGSAEGGGVYADGTVDIYGSTIADNVGDGIDTAGGTVELGADLLASNSGLDCAGGGISDAGYNYADDVSCPTGSGNSHDSAASLDLASLNTSTGTVAVTSSSEAYDVVPTGTTLSGDPTGAFCLGIDERGAPRIEGGASACSAGAYQYAGAVITGVSSPALELGLTVTLTGSNLGSVISATFGATPAAITSQTSTSLSLALPLSLAFGSQPITLVSQYDSATVPFAAVANPGVATLTLPPGEHGVPYSEPVPVSGGRAPFSFATVSGALPRGLSLSSAGVISGTPTSTGGSAFGVVVSDANGVVAATQNVSLTIAVPVISIKSKTAKVSHNELPVVLGCTFAPCAGTVTLTGSVTTTVKGHETTTSATLASATYATLAPKTGVELELVLTAKGRKMLARVAKHHLHELVIASVDAGQTIASNVAVF